MSPINRLPTYNDRVMHPPSRSSASLLLSTRDIGVMSASMKDSISINAETRTSPMPTQGLNAIASPAPRYGLIFNPLPTTSLSEQLDIPFIYRPHLSGTVCQRKEIISLSVLLAPYFISHRLVQLLTSSRHHHPQNNMVLIGLVLSAQEQELSLLSGELREEMTHAMQTTIFFPSSLDVYKYYPAANPHSDKYWTCRATINGVELEKGECPSSCFVRNGGATFEDCQTILNVMREGTSTSRLWT